MLYLALDPGKSTGFVIFRDKQLQFSCTVEDFNWVWLMEKIEQVTCTEDDVTIISEDFRVYPGMGQQQAMQPIYACHIIGMLEYFVYLRSREGKKFTFIKQWAATAKQHITDNVLKEHKLYKGTRHEKDAIRHFLHVYLKNN